MNILKNKKKSANKMTDFERVFVNKKEKPNPVIKAGCITLCATFLLALVICVVMAVLDKTGVAPSPLPTKDKTADKAVTVDVSQHPESLKKLYAENFETADFVASYFKEKDKTREVSLKKYKKSRQVPLFVQWDKQWGYFPYGDDIIGVNGDGPVCLAMAGYYLSKDGKFSPDKVAAFADEKGYFKKDKGTLPALMLKGATELGLVSSAVKNDTASITAAMDAGKVVICLMEKGKLASSSHFVVLREYKAQTLFINDPTSKVNSEKQWLFDEILPEVKSAWAISL